MSISFQQKKAAWQAQLFDLREEDTSSLALDMFRYQARHNSTYCRYLRALRRKPSTVNSLSEIPFLPISLYRSQPVRTGQWSAETCFQSSGTTAEQPSLHFVDDLSFYERVATRGFEQWYGSLRGMLILALLPDYLSRPNSSLVYMLQAFMRRSEERDSRFFMNEWEELSTCIRSAAKDPRPKQLWGLPLALLDFAEAYPDLPLQDFIVIETGGTKRNSPQSKADLHLQLRTHLRPKALHSEYGMTELLSQAYAVADPRFRPPPWMRVFARHPEDPLELLPRGETGALSIVDLANMHSCAFLATEDLGCVYEDGSFELLGRVAASSPRGCRLLYEK